MRQWQMPETWRARKIITMDTARPEATHVAVDEGRILAVGNADDAEAWGYPVDDRYAGHVILPGFVEAHGHLVTGGIWDFIYVGAQARRHPDGHSVSGIRDNRSIVSRLQAEAPVQGAVIGWGLDPIFIEPPRLSSRDLDEIATDRPVAILHSNLHAMTVNSHVMEMVQYGRDSDIPGIVRDAGGAPTGELREFAAMFPVMRRLGIDFGGLANSERALERYGRLALQSGVTTITDLLNDLPEDAVSMMQAYTGAGDCPIRLTVALNALGGKPEDIAAKAQSLAPLSSDRLRLGSVKLMTDGSIQAFTAQLKDPGYHRGDADPMWNVAPEQLERLIDVLHGARLRMHIHTNGDLAIEVAIGALEKAVAAHENWDHRHTLQHFQMAEEAHIARLKAIGGAANIFANHVYYFGDQHHDVTLGPERAARIDPCGSALAQGLPIAIHSDTPVTPLAPLFSMNCAVNRKTESGRVLGPDQRIGRMEALHAITLGAAWTLKMDDEVGSIAAGKHADFTVLEEDPLEVEAERIGEIRVAGTVSGGRHFGT